MDDVFEIIGISVWVIVVVIGLHGTAIKSAGLSKMMRTKNRKSPNLPIAKCSCKDCKYWNGNGGRCSHFKITGSLNNVRLCWDDASEETGCSDER